ncbi:hypothetical protein D3C77_636580 [compost metagenome]
MLAHQLTIGTLDGGGIVAAAHAQHLAGIFQRWATMRLLIAALGVSPLLPLPAAAAKLTPAFNHAEELIELSAGDPQLFGDHIQHLAFIRMQRAIGKRGLDLNFQKHPNQVKATKTDAA